MGAVIALVCATPRARWQQSNSNFEVIDGSLGASGKDLRGSERRLRLFQSCTRYSKELFNKISPHTAVLSQHAVIRENLSASASAGSLVALASVAASNLASRDTTNIWSSFTPHIGTGMY